ncbi:unnamed protein product [Protopolystoma xenopodis]|uniref:Rab-GAP TBC domain-containing protein n=1 Tax=Protopolystoma xenopodis TaxID=117903 RepID=A0A3S5B1U7_9PLAT|nr:unnamed protein product [Protopolystoma xenopodis]
MSQLAGLFLMYVEEEDAFWCVAQLLHGPRHQHHAIFADGFPGLLRLFSHHEKILKRFLPDLDHHFSRQSVLTSTYAVKWFMQCFLDRVTLD